MDPKEIEDRIWKVTPECAEFERAVKSAPPGFLLEFGVYKGESLNYIADMLNPRPVFGFDSFEGLPETWREGTEEKGCFKTEPPTNLRNNAFIIIGMFDDTIPRFFNYHLNPKVSFVHIDCDLYSSTKTVLTNLKERFVENAIIAFDEIVGYKGHEDHELKAFSEFLAETGYDFDVMARRYTCSAVVRLKR